LTAKENSMIDGQFVVSVERLRDDLATLKSDIHKKYKLPDRQVILPDLQVRASHLAEVWLVGIGARNDVQAVVSSELLGNLNVAFQRLLTFAEHATQRVRYDREIAAILKGFTLDVVIPLKRALANIATPQPAGAAHIVTPAAAEVFSPTAFVGHSFAVEDQTVNNAIIEALTSLGIAVETGAKPRAERISDKVKELIARQHIFVGIFTRRDKIARKNEWTTSPWVIDEKAYAVGANKKLILLRETGVGSIGGIQGDYEYFPFDRAALHSAVLTLIGLLELKIAGLRK
jgi:hypothetical protein